MRWYGMSSSFRPSSVRPNSNARPSSGVLVVNVLPAQNSLSFFEDMEFHVDCCTSSHRFKTLPPYASFASFALCLVLACLFVAPLNAQDDPSSVGETSDTPAVVEPPVEEGSDVEVEPEPAESAEPQGLDDWINEKFKPISDAWGGLVLTPVPIGTQLPAVETLMNAETIEKVGIDDALSEQISGLMDKRDADVLAEPNGHRKSEIVADYNGQIMALLSPEQLEAFREPRQVPVVLMLLVASAAFFTIVFGFINVRLIPFAIKVVRGHYDELEKTGARDVIPDVNEVEGDVVDTIRDEGEEGEVSHFQALATAVSGTVGLGNIAGVALAIAIGGPGATFWMIVCGLLGMSTKFVECTLGVKYRDIDEDGVVHGGPMYYLRKGLGELGIGPVGQVLGIVFAILCVGASLGGGNMFQSNQAAEQIITMAGIESGFAGTGVGIVLAILVGIVIIGGIKRIATVTEKVVPLMAFIYVAAALIIILSNITSIPYAVGQIISGAFTPLAGFGGLVGVLLVGFQRAAFSNEAGAGSAAIAHSAVKTKYPASEGVVALLEPFIDTVVICTMTALVIVLFNADGKFQYADVVDGEVLLGADRVGGVGLTSMAFDSVLPGFRYLLTVAIILFAFSTMISWSYYGLQSWKYLFGRSQAADMSYKIMFCVFVVIGAATSMKSVTDFSDAMILALVFPNMFGLLLMFPKVRKELNSYLEKARAVEEANSN